MTFTALQSVEEREVLRAAFAADVTPLLRAVRAKLGVPADPLAAYRASGYEARVAKERTAKRKALGGGGDAEAEAVGEGPAFV